MAPLTIDDFDEFFVAINGYRPFAWQTRLARRLVEQGRWPDTIDAPTGSGKSSVVEIHVFANAASAAGETRGLAPRRLVVAVDRRALVDDQHERAKRVAMQLQTGADVAGLPSAIVQRVATRLRGLSTAPSEGVLGVALLRGGEAPDRNWLDDPAACQVIAATPDMFGSRLLFRGYASRRFAHPREAGLLAFDTVVVVDEAHLSRQLLVTVDRVRDLTAPDAARLSVPGLQLVQMTATPGATPTDPAGVDAADLDDATLAHRLLRPKPVRLRRQEGWPASSASPGRVADALVEEVLLALETASGTVACIVNTVRMATEVTARLRSSVPSPGIGHPEATSALTVKPIIGRMRPYDIARLRSDHPGLFRLGGDPRVDVVVATQTIEVGVDMDFAAMVTELAPGSSIAQRAGRVNRSGARESASIVVVGPEDESAIGRGAPPYESVDLVSAWSWLGERSTDPAGLAPWAIHPRGGAHVPPSATGRRPVYHRPEEWNVREWARTADDPYVAHDLALWLDEDFEPDLTALVVLREGMPDDVIATCGLLDAAPPQPHEGFPVRLSELRALLSRAPAEADGVSRAFLVRAGVDTGSVAIDDLPAFSPRPGDVVVLDATAKVLQLGGKFDTKTNMAQPGVVLAVGRDRGDDVSERALPPALARHRGERSVRFSVGAPVFTDVESTTESLLKSLATAPGDPPATTAEDARTETLRTWLAQVEGTPDHPLGNESRDLLSSLLADLADGRAEIITPTAPSDVLTTWWLVIAGTNGRRSDDEARQIWSPRRGLVELGTHQAAVAASAAALGQQLCLAEPLVDALRDAGLHHDDGKADDRFQRSLRSHDDQSPGLALAKSGMWSSRTIARARQRSGLTTGWRHEQLSAVVAWDQLSEANPNHRDLVVRLVGTSHGRGRSNFDHTAGALTADPALSPTASLLYDDAEWDLLLERTRTEWGTWGCAYLEALLRAADGQVSRSGS